MTSQGKENDGAWLLPSFIKEAIMMTDFQMLSLVIMIFMLVFAAMSYSKKLSKPKPPSSAIG